MNNFADIDVDDRRCQGCGEPVVLSRVRAGEDDTAPWRATVPPGHSVLSVQEMLVQFRCRNGDNYAVLTPVSASSDSARELDWWRSQLLSKKKDLIVGADCERTLATPEEIEYFERKIRGLGGDTSTVDHETWIEYHDRLVKEYYDFDAEWALIKEICPELEKTAPVMKQPLPKHVRQARAWAIGFAIWAVVSFIALDWTSTAVVATVWALVFATMYRYWSTRPPCASRPRAAAPRRPGGTP